VTPRSDGDAVESALTGLVRDYDKRWSSLDLLGLAELWERDDPQPIYVGDEYAAPLIGNDQLDRHWARVAGRLKSASVSSTLHEYDVVDDTVVRALLLSRWSLTGRDADVQRTGASWITWLLVRRGGRYRIFHQMESQVYLTDSEGQ
jgi:hypothetical protein